MFFRVHLPPLWMLSASLLGALALPCSAHAQEAPHAHGAAKLSIAVEGRGFSAQLESPLDNLVGFEHAPRDKREEQAVRAMAQTLRGADALFKANAQAECRAGGSELSASALPPALIGNAAKKAAKPSPKAEHTDLDANYEFQCARPERLNRLDLSPFFSAFARLRRIEVQLVTPKRQMKRTLTRTSAVLQW